jgi:hypothetical protein
VIAYKIPSFPCSATSSSLLVALEFLILAFTEKPSRMYSSAQRVRQALSCSMLFDRHQALISFRRLSRSVSGGAGSVGAGRRLMASIASKEFRAAWDSRSTWSLSVMVYSKWGTRIALDSLSSLNSLGSLKRENLVFFFLFL